MDTGFLNFHDEEHFSDFSLSLEQNVVERPQDLLMHMVENDFDYMETHLDITNSDNRWNTDQEHSEDVDETSMSEAPTMSKIDSIKEDFAKVLTDWQEHIGYLQASDMDEYIDVIGISMNSTDKRNFCMSQSILHDEQEIHNLDSDSSTTKQADLTKESPYSNQGIVDLNSCNKDTDFRTENKSCHNIDDFAENDNKKVKTKSKSLLLESKHLRSQSKLRKNIHKYDGTGFDMPVNSIKKQKKKKKEKSLQQSKGIQRDDRSIGKSVENELPVLEAGDVKSLLEQFEASENTLVSTSPAAETNAEYESSLPVKANKIQRCIKQSEVSNLHKNIRDALPKEVIEKIKTSARKKVISVIPAMPNIQSNGRSNGTRMQDAAATLFRNKLLKIVTNNTKSNTIDGGLVQLDHDYCSTNSSVNSSDSNSEYDRQSSDSERVSSVKHENQRQSHYYTAYEKQSFSSHSNRNLMKSKEYSMESNSKKDSGLESGEVSDNGEEQPVVTIVSDVKVNKSMQELQNETKVSKKQVLTNEGNYQPVDIPNNTAKCTTSQNLAESTKNSVHEMKIHSALATNILQLRQGILSKTNFTKVGNQRTKQMVSVLKKPPNVQVSVLMTTANESVVTTTNSANNEVQNIIVQESEKVLTPEEEKKPPRKKLNLAEYRSRREQNRSDNSRTNSPLQPMTLIYVHHASTTTEPIKDDPTNLIWSEREIVSVLKPKVEVDENKIRPKPATCEIGIQTYETVFEFPAKSSTDVDERDEQQRDSHARDRNQRTCNGHRVRSNSSRSRSRSKSKSKSKSRSRSRSSSNRSRSRKRSNTRHRRISHRRSSVSSNSSWSSHSRSRSRSQSQSRSRSRSRSCSDTRSTFSSRSRYSRSRSRSSRSRSRSSSRYSSCSRSSSRSNFGRNKWSGRREHGKYKKYERHRKTSTGSYHAYRDWRRSPTNSFRRSCDNWYDREKQRQVEERRVIYVGRLEEGITKADLRRRFEAYGPVVDISVHFREHGDNYGFVTFAYKNDAYEAVEHGNDDPALPRYDLCFGGRRAFCKVKYADLDGMANSSLSGGRINPDSEDNTFDLLLKEAKAKLRKRKV